MHIVCVYSTPDQAILFVCLRIIIWIAFVCVCDVNVCERAIVSVLLQHRVIFVEHSWYLFVCFWLPPNEDERIQQ